MYNKQQIINDLKAIGIVPGDMLFIRVSYKAIGKVEGGPQMVIDALLEVIGSEGTLIATAFFKRIAGYERFFQRNKIYTQDMTPFTGILPVIMSQNSEAHFSENLISPYVAIGKYAAALTSAHTIDRESYAIVEDMISNYNPKCLRIGGDALDGTAHLAFSAGLKNSNNYQSRIRSGIYYKINNKIKWKDRTVSAFCYSGFEKFYNQYIVNSDFCTIGMVGSGKAFVTDMKKTAEIEQKIIGKNPSILLCDNPHCVTCRTSFSYSDTSPLRFVGRQIIRIINGEVRQGLSAIKDLMINKLLGYKCQ